MLRILQFLYSLRSFLLFVLLEVLAIGLIVSNNSPQGAAFFNSSNAVTGSVLKTRSDVIDFFSLAEANKTLLQKNAELLEEVKNLKEPADSIFLQLDSALAVKFEYKGARIISNSLRFSQNHLTINKGSNDGIKPGMGIFNEEGVIGRVKSVSANYAVGISLLNTGLLVSSLIKPNDVLGTVNWDGKDSKRAKMIYVPRHVIANVGDTVVTSGYSGVFPEGIKIGIISKVDQGTDPNYLDIEIELSTDFSSIHYVYLVDNTHQAEIDSLYQEAGILDEL